MSDEPQILIAGGRGPRGRWEHGNRGAVGRRGALCEDEPTSPVTVRLPVSLHDHLVKLAQMQQQSVSAVVRSLLRTKLR